MKSCWTSLRIYNVEMKLFKQSDELPTLTFMIKFPRGLRAEQHLTRFGIVVPTGWREVGEETDLQVFFLLWNFWGDSPEPRPRRKGTGQFFFVSFWFEGTFGTQNADSVKSQPVPWLLDSKTPFLKNGENSQMACLERWKPPSASARRGEPEDDSITRNRFLR